MGRLRPLFWAAGAAVGLVAEWVSFGWADPRNWIPDLAVGWTFIGWGLIAAARRQQSRAGALMAATGFAWFAGNFSQSSWEGLAWLGEQTTFLYLGVLLHCALSYPSGRLSGYGDRMIVAVGYALAVVVTPEAHDAGTIALALLLPSATGCRYLATRGPARRTRLPAVQASVLAGSVLAAGVVVRLALPLDRGDAAVLLSEQAALIVAATVLFSGLVRRSVEETAVADLVVDLGEVRSGTLRDALAEALGDSTLEVGYWSPEAGAYVDGSGRGLDFPGPGLARSVTTVERDGIPVAALVHDTAVLDDPVLVEAVARATRLAAVNARLQAEVRAQVAEVQSSRRRLVEAGDAERLRLERRLSGGAGRRLLALQHALAEMDGRRHPAAGAETAERLARAEAQLARTIEELRELARGLHPHVLAEEGLTGALRSLAGQSPVPVDLFVGVEAAPDDVETALYFVCAEALANVAKYASASHVSVDVKAVDGAVALVVVDDGAGGAGVAGGTGLRGLADRVEALGGTLEIDSPRGKGTRLMATIPTL
jgi:signal transduction histidine kinase